MPGIYELASRYISPYYLPFIVVFLFVLFSLAGYYIYTYYYGTQKNKPDDADAESKGDKESKPENVFEWLKGFWNRKEKYKNENQQIVKPGEIITVYFFTADWCPHCRNAKPAIDQFQKEYHDTKINNKKISITRVDCTDSEIKDVAKQIDHFNVTSFPTVKIQDSNGKIFEFDAKITNDNLENFVKTVANN